MLYAYNTSACVPKARSSKASSVLGQYGERMERNHTFRLLAEVVIWKDNYFVDQIRRTEGKGVTIFLWKREGRKCSKTKSWLEPTTQRNKQFCFQESQRRTSSDVKWEKETGKCCYCASCKYSWCLSPQQWLENSWRTYQVQDWKDWMWRRTETSENWWGLTSSQGRNSESD